jgi:SAM-dependent methyltransferase
MQIGRFRWPIRFNDYELFVESLSTYVNRSSALPHGFNLFLVGFLVLFLELACIRWFSAYVIFLQFFTNVVLIACFLGMSCGCLTARRCRNWLALFPFIALTTVIAAFAMFVVYHFWHGLAVDVGHQVSPQEVFFGTEYRFISDVARFIVPIELIVAVFFILIALMFVGLGQVLGRAFDAYPNRVLGYTLNISGSIIGILVFSALSFAHMRPVIWFLISCAGVAYLLYQDKALSLSRMLALVTLLTIIAMPPDWLYSKHETRWSPYYVVTRTMTGNITVNNIAHQSMLPFETSGAIYSLIHLLNRDSGGPPLQDVLIIGAGTGNDIAHALHFGVKRIDAVEIDPVIRDIGIHYHPDKPYQDRRVISYLGDGRHFLRTTDRKYDLVVYALVDSLILHSSYANLRLESYLFTEQAFADIRRVLKPDGIFVAYNYYRQGWIVERVVAMAKQAFGCDPIVLGQPFVEDLKSSERAGFMTIIAGCNPRIAAAFREHGTFWLNIAPPKNLSVDGFTVQPGSTPVEQKDNWRRIAPTRLIHDQEASTQLPSDDWPFLYTSGKLLPRLAVRSMIVLGVLGILMVYLFMPKGRIRLNNRMFFLGAAFMLLETKAVVQMALLFGSTWVVSAAVFFTVLVVILLANLYVLKTSSTRLGLHYATLLVLLAATVLVPFDAFLSGGIVWRYVVPCVLALGPMFFAGVIFARSFRDEPNPDQAFGSNIAGSVIGGLSELFSTLLGFQHLLILAICFYLLSTWASSAPRRLNLTAPAK